jgi:hypothetical protein
MTISALALAALLVQDADWRTWRGPTGNGVAAPGERPPLTWSDTENVVWKTPVPGRGYSSACVVGSLVTLTTADDAAQVQSVLGFDRGTGRPLWKTEVHRGGFPPKIHKKNSHATPSVVSDGERLYTSFFNREAVHVTALSLEGKVVWQETVGGLKPIEYQHGYAPTPVLHQGLVLVAVDSDEGGYLAALDAKSGKPKWKTARPKKCSFATPVVARIGGRDQLLLSGAEQVAGYDPVTGKALWSAADATTHATCGTLVWDGDLVFGSGGWPKAETVGVKADGSGRVVWRNPKKCYEQSLLAHAGHVYAVDDAGVAYCWKAADGTQLWAARIGGKASASPVLAGGNLYVTTERGQTVVFPPDPAGFRELARNSLGDEALATPSFCGDRVYARVIRTAGGRQEWLYCLGLPPK